MGIHVNAKRGPISNCGKPRLSRANHGHYRYTSWVPKLSMPCESHSALTPLISKLIKAYQSNYNVNWTLSALCSMYVTCPFLKAYFCSFSLLEYNWGFPGGSVVKNLPASAGDARDAALIPGSGRSPGVGKVNPLQ